MISCCVAHKFLQNIGTLPNKQHRITHTAEWLQITPIQQYIIQEEINTHNGHSGCFLSNRGSQINKNCEEN